MSRPTGSRFPLFKRHLSFQMPGLVRGDSKGFEVRVTSRNRAWGNRVFLATDPDDVSTICRQFLAPLGAYVEKKEQKAVGK